MNSKKLAPDAAKLARSWAKKKRAKDLAKGKRREGEEAMTREHTKSARVEAKTTRCTTCSAEFSDEELERHTLDVDGPDRASCPACKSPSVPMSIAQDVKIDINWHELRILTIWASNYAETLGSDARAAQSRASLAQIIRRLERQRPENFPALTIVGEVRDMQRAGIDVEMRKEDGTVIVPRKDPAS